MPSLLELSLDKLRIAGDATETLIEFRDYLPPGGMLLMLAGKFRDDIRELLGLPEAPRVTRGPERKRLGGMEDKDLDCLFEAALILHGAFTGYMDDPELPRRLSDLLGQLGLERDARHIAEEAKAS